jgi:hypothetical protein
MLRILLLIFPLFAVTTAQSSIILIMKTMPRPGLETETDALTEIVASKLTKFQNYRGILWDDMEVKLGKEKMSEIIRCQDSGCIVRFTNILKQNRLNPHYMLFCSIVKYGTDFTVTLKIADAINGMVFGMVNSTIPNLESFHSSAIVESIIRKIPIYISRNSSVSVNNISIPGVNALGNNSSYLANLTSNTSELKSYLDFFNYHDERNKLLINTMKPIDSLKFPSVAVYKPQASDSLKNTLAVISFIDSINKRFTNAPVTIYFNGDSNKLIRQIILKTTVPSQTRFGIDYSDLKKRVLGKITDSNFTIDKADSIAGIYGVNYYYHYNFPQKSPNVKLTFMAEASAFTVIINRSE